MGHVATGPWARTGLKMTRGGSERSHAGGIKPAMSRPEGAVLGRSCVVCLAGTELLGGTTGRTRDQSGRRQPSDRTCGLRANPSPAARSSI
jgi:hypothetical protein